MTGSSDQSLKVALSYSYSLYMIFHHFLHKVKMITGQIRPLTQVRKQEVELFLQLELFNTLHSFFKIID